MQRPHPPICVGGSGEERTLRTAARFAKHWNFDGGTPGQFSRARDVLHRHCAEAGRDPAEILLSGQVRFTGDPAEAVTTAAALGAPVDPGPPGMQVLARWCRVGFSAPCARAARGGANSGVR